MNFIPHSKPTVGKAEADAVAEVIRSSMLAQGQRVDEFERLFAQRFELGQAVAVGSGTAGLHLALLALGVGPGDDVIIPSFVCTALLNAVCYVGAQANVADIRLDTFNIDPVDVRKRITARTKAIIVPHMFGQAADLRGLKDIGLPIIEDCAQAVGARYAKRPVGSFGDLSVFSFYATKVMTTGEGGMVSSHDPFLIEKVRDARAYDNRSEYSIRFNYKMTDIQAAMGIVQLERLKSFLKKRKTLADTYTALFLEESDSRLSLPLGVEEHTYFRYVVRIERNIGKICENLRDLAFGTARPVFKPIHRYLTREGFPKTDQAWETTISLPIYPELKIEDVKRIAKAFIGQLE